MLQLGLLIYVVANIMTAFLHYIDSVTWFLIGMIFTRIMLGISYGLIATTCKLLNIGYTLVIVLHPS